MSLERGTSRRSVGINRKLNLARRELSFLPTYDPKLGSGVRLKGSDYVGSLATGVSGGPIGSVLADILVAPGEFDNTRIQQFSSLFERYRVRSWTFWYIPSVPSTQAGQFLAYPDYDVSDSLSPTLPLNEAMAHMGSQLFNVYSETPIQFDRVDPFTDLFTDAEGTDQRLTYVGRIRFLAASALGASVSFGTIYMEYDIDFYIPQLQSTAIETVVTGTASLKSCTPQAASVSNGAVISCGMLETGAPLNSPNFDLGVGNIFSADFISDAVAKTTTLDGSQLSGLNFNTVQRLFFKILPLAAGYSGGNVSAPKNTSYITLARSLADLMTMTGGITSVSGGSKYALTGFSENDWINTSGGLVGGGDLMGLLSNIRLIPQDRYASIIY
jgi:hypothetical protein